MGLKRTSVAGPLRERKKASTQAALRSTALRLFREKGFAAVSVDEIAAHADVSRSTFFRYFGSKEAVLFNDWDESEEVFLQELRNRPSSETHWEAFEEALIVTSNDAQDRRSPDERLVVDDLLRNDPALSGRRLKELARVADRMAGVLASRAGRAEPGLEDRLAAATCMAIGEEIGRFWREDPSSDPIDLIREAFKTARTF
jgi:AcrR family transcriptional regulator